MKKHLFVVNPAAGGKRARNDTYIKEIQEFSDAMDELSEVYYTQGPMDACAKIKQEATEHEELRVYACGGDGTLNECVNGAALSPNVAVGIYPHGTGNDFLKTFGERDMAKFRDLRTLVAGETRAVDLIDCNGRYGVNICSVGIDARVGTDVHKYSKIPIIGGSTAYVVSLMVNTIKGVKTKMRVIARDIDITADYSLICACNGRFYGGGFNPVPEALIDDGVLEFLLVAGVSRLKVAQIVKRYSQGRFRELADVITHIRGDYLRICCEKTFVVNVDGEAIYSDDINFKLIPGGVNIIFPPGLEYFN